MSNFELFKSGLLSPVKQFAFSLSSHICLPDINLPSFFTYLAELDARFLGCLFLVLPIVRPRQSTSCGGYKV